MEGQGEIGHRRSHKDPDLLKGLNTHAPTISRQGILLLLQILASNLEHGWTGHAGDVTAAFLSGEVLTRELFLRQPKTGLGNLSRTTTPDTQADLRVGGLTSRLVEQAEWNPQGDDRGRRRGHPVDDQAVRTRQLHLHGPPDLPGREQEGFPRETSSLPWGPR